MKWKETRQLEKKWRNWRKNDSVPLLTRFFPHALRRSPYAKRRRLNDTAPTALMLKASRLTSPLPSSLQSPPLYLVPLPLHLTTQSYHLILLPLPPPFHPSPYIEALAPLTPSYRLILLPPPPLHQSPYATLTPSAAALALNDTALTKRLFVT